MSEVVTACSHADGAAFVDGACVLCGAKRGPGRPKGTRRMNLLAGYELGLKAAGVETRPEGARPPWIKTDGKLRKVVRNPLPYRSPSRDIVTAPPNAKAEVDPDEHERALNERICRLSFAEFVKAAWSVMHGAAPLFWNWHMQAVCDHTQRMAEELFKARSDISYEMVATNLMVNIPPRCSKSMIVSVFLPAWLWLRDPTLKIRCCSSNPRVSSRDSRYCRDLIASKWYRETFAIPWTIRHDIDGVERFDNTERGERHASTFNAKVTGEGTDIIIVDDPHDAKEVTSDVKRQSVLDKWDAALESRVNDRLRCLRIGVMQRLHESDWCGHVTRSGKWVWLHIPMEFDPGRRCETRIGDWTWCDPRTEPGELLHPDRFPLKELRGGDDPNGTGGLYYTLGTYGWAGQMQQTPAPADGGIFLRAWFQWIDETALPDKFDDIVISADLANKARDVKLGSFNVLTVIAKRGVWRYVLDVERGRGSGWTPKAITEKLTRLQKDWGRKLGRTPKIIVEDKAVGPTVIDMLMSDAKVPGVIQDDEAQQARDDKVSRALAVSPLVEGKTVALLKGAPWAEAFLHELTTFPMSTNDDQVDTFTMALNYWRMSRGASSFMAAYGGSAA